MDVRSTRGSPPRTPFFFIHSLSLRIASAFAISTPKRPRRSENLPHDPDVCLPPLFFWHIEHEMNKHT